MKKFKYLLILSVLTFAIGCLLVGCEITGEVDKERNPILVMYCANGGTINGKAERYLFLEKGVTVPEPGVSSAIAAPTRTGYRFMGWVEGKVDTSKVFYDPSNENKIGLHYSPKLKEGEDVEAEVELVSAPSSDGKTTRYSLDYEINSEYGAQDGGVFMTVDGAVASDEVVDTLLNTTIPQSTKDAIRLRLYDYDRKAENYDFTKRVDGSQTDIVLIAVWANYNQYIVADWDDEKGEWEDESAYSDLLESMQNDPNWIEGEAYLSLKATNRLFDVSGGGGTQIYGRNDILKAYNATRNPKYYAAQIDLDAKTEDFNIKNNAWQKEGKPTDADSTTYKEYIEAQSELDKAQAKYDEEKANIKHTAIRFFDSKDTTRKGESDLTDVRVYDVGDKPLTVFYFTEYQGDVDVIFDYSEFEASITSGRDMYIDEDIDASAQKIKFAGRNISNVNIMGNGHFVSFKSEVTQEDHSDQSANIYGSIFGTMRNVRISDLTLKVDVVFWIAVSPYELNIMNQYVLDENGQRIPVPGNEKCYVGLLAKTMEGCSLNKVNIDVSYTIDHTEIDYVTPNPDGGTIHDMRKNDFEVEVNFTKLQSQGEDTSGNNTITDCTYNAVQKTVEQPAEPDDNE